MVKKVMYILFAVVVILGIVVIASYIANLIFNKKVNQEARELLHEDFGEKKVITETDLADLPTPVRKWLNYSQVVGKEKIQTVRLKQRGVMRTKGDQPWMPIEATQYVNVENPAFVWQAKAKAAPLIYIACRDKYIEGQGNMLIKLQSLIPIADAKGDEMNQGTLTRFLGEMIWYPTFALSEYIRWESIDDYSAKATMSFRGTTDSGTFIFNEKGEVTKFTTKRYIEQNGKYQLEDWSGNVKDYKDFGGIKIPTNTECIWSFQTGDFTWFVFDIDEIDYNISEVY